MGNCNHSTIIVSKRTVLQDLPFTLLGNYHHPGHPYPLLEGPVLSTCSDKNDTTAPVLPKYHR